MYIYSTIHAYMEIACLVDSFPDTWATYYLIYQNSPGYNLFIIKLHFFLYYLTFGSTSDIIYYILLRILFYYIIFSEPS